MKQKRHFFLAALLAALVLFIVSPANAAGANKPAAGEIIGSSGITWTPKVNYSQMVVTLSRPDGTKFDKTFESGSAPYLDLSDILGNTPCDGSYTYELRVIPPAGKRIRKSGGFGDNKRKGDAPPRGETLTQTGYFWVQGGMIVTPSSTGEDLSRPMDIVHADDVIIDGSLCVGNDCYSGLAFGFDTIVLMENNLRIFFDDTSSIQNYPRNDWRIIANDSTDGGGNYFAIQDATDVSNILVMEAGAPNNSLYVDSHGDVGINTSTPYYELHIVDGDSPCVRLDQDGSYGWTPQKWDLCGNESNFFIRDATHASKLPFRIQPEAPTDSIFIKSDGKVGFGTGSPGYPMELECTGTNATFAIDRTDGATAKITAGASGVQFGSQSNHQVKIVVNNSTAVMTVNTDETLDMSDGGSYDGTWNDASSREYKENIRDLAAGEAIEALAALAPVKFNYKKHKEDEKLGFIAEDVPELVATKDRKNLSAMDITAVLTKVLQQQQQAMQEQQKTIAGLKKKIEELEKKITDK
jgi:hypothetical protein